MTDNIGLVLLAVLSIFIIIIISVFVDVASVLVSIKEVDWFQGATALFLYLISIFLRSLRVLLLVPHANVVSLFGLLAKFSALNYFIPMKLGELTFPIMLVREGVTNQEAFRFWGLVRGLDFLVVCLISIFVVMNSQFDHILNPSVLIIGALLLLCGLAGVLFRQRVYGIFKYLCRFGGFKWLALVVLTFSSWALVYAMYYFAFMSLGYEISISICILAMAVMLPLSLLPVSTMANVGVFHSAWVVVLVSLGWSKSIAFGAATEAHLLVSLIVAIVGCIGAFIWFSYKKLWS